MYPQQNRDHFSNIPVLLLYSTTTRITLVVLLWPSKVWKAPENGVLFYLFDLEGISSFILNQYKKCTRFSDGLVGFDLFVALWLVEVSSSRKFGIQFAPRSIRLTCIQTVSEQTKSVPEQTKTIACIVNRCTDTQWQTQTNCTCIVFAAFEVEGGREWVG